MSALQTNFIVPDLWQQRAVSLLAAEHDVIIDAPTGSGKTFIFELLVEQGIFRKCIYTVPTRALANDKFREWEDRGWRVGIETGDISYRSDASIVVATLETQKRKLMMGQGPELLVVDEYQMLSDADRGVNYELALAMAPKETRLLLLSGSVANPKDIQTWLQRSGRSIELVRHHERPVPQEELSLDALPQLSSRSAIQGRWARYLARVLQADLGPILVFTPRRKAAEVLALQLARQLEEPDVIALSPEQKAIAGRELTSCLKQRIGFHHSGMSYAQRAALVEPLAKTNQLKVIVATTGLAAGINFAMRSVLISDNEYRVPGAHRRLRPDELLQMFGRAGRRGLDKRGYSLYTTGTPRLIEARPLRLTRDKKVDWPSLITVLGIACARSESPLQATRKLTNSLFSETPVILGLENFLNRNESKQLPRSEKPKDQMLSGGKIREFQNSEGIWERRRATILTPLSECLLRENEKWVPALSSPRIPASLKLGQLWKIGCGRKKRYGLKLPLAQLKDDDSGDKLVLAKWLLRRLREQSRAEGKKSNIPKHWKLEAIERRIVPKMAILTNGGTLTEIAFAGNDLCAYLDYSDAKMHAYRDLASKALLNPRERIRRIPGTADLGLKQSGDFQKTQSVAEQWFQLGLIDRDAKPTRRGTIFSFFNHGEGLAISAALEAVNYPIEELLFDLANIRAGHRFNAVALAGRPLTQFCQEAYGAANIPGYLLRGLPEAYGEGASEIIYNIEAQSNRIGKYLNDEVSRGDIERAQLEWRSLCTHVAYAPDFEWDRWRALKQSCRNSIERSPNHPPLLNLPSLNAQRGSNRTLH